MTEEVGTGFVNKVAESGLITFDLAELAPKVDQLVTFDLKQFLFMELILKEKDYREALKNFDWEPYRNKIVGVYCSTDAIIPVWAYMLAASYLTGVAQEIVMSTPEELFQKVLSRNIDRYPVEKMEGKRVVVKGCGDTPIGNEAYLAITARLKPIVKSIMYGEPCSTVPIYKRKD